MRHVERGPIILVVRPIGVLELLTGLNGHIDDRFLWPTLEQRIFGTREIRHYVSDESRYRRRVLRNPSEILLGHAPEWLIEGQASSPDASIVIYIPRRRSF